MAVTARAKQAGRGSTARRASEPAWLRLGLGVRVRVRVRGRGRGRGRVRFRRRVRVSVRGRGPKGVGARPGEHATQAVAHGGERHEHLVRVGVGVRV